MMKTNDGFQHAFNAQAMVDEGAQVIVAAEVSNQASDAGQLLPMITVTETNLDAAGIEEDFDVVLSDAGYCSEQNLNDAKEAAVDVLIPTGRIRRGEHVPASPRGPVPKNATARERMGRRLRTKKGGPTTPAAKPSSNRSSTR